MWLFTTEKRILKENVEYHIRISKGEKYMKKLIIVNGTPGIGKTTVCKNLYKRI